MTLYLRMFNDMNIERMPTIPYNPEKNGLAKRLNLKIINAMRAALET